MRPWTDGTPLAEALAPCRRVLDGAPPPDARLRFQPPWPALDDHLADLGPGDVALVAGWPLQGKTWLALELALRASRCGPVSFLSRTLAPEALALRALALASGIDVHRLANGYLSAPEADRAKAALEELAGCRLVLGTWADDGAEGRDGPRQIMATPNGDDPPVLAVVDDLGLSSATFPWDPRRLRQDLGTWQDEAGRAGIPLVLVAGLPFPEGTHSPDARPGPADLAASGIPPDLARAVILMHRPETLRGGDPEAHRRSHLDLLAVHTPRHPGCTTVVECRFDRASGRIAERSAPGPDGPDPTGSPD